MLKLVVSVERTSDMGMCDAVYLCKFQILGILRNEQFLDFRLFDR